MKLIRQMDVGFNTSDFLSEVKSTVPDVIKSYLLGDVESLKKMENISLEIIERMDGQINAWKSLGHVVDARLLHVSELELVEIRVLDNSPTVVLQFACQQVNCVPRRERRKKSSKVPTTTFNPLPIYGPCSYPTWSLKPKTGGNLASRRGSYERWC